MIPHQQRPGGQDLAEALGEVAARVRRLGGFGLGRHSSSAALLAGVSVRQNAVGGYGWARALGDAEVLGCRTEAGEVLLTITGVLDPWLPPLQVSVSVWVGVDELVAPGTPPYEDRPVAMAALRRLAQAQDRQDKAWKTYAANKRVTERREVLARFVQDLPEEFHAAIKGLPT